MSDGLPSKGVVIFGVVLFLLAILGTLFIFTFLPQETITITELLPERLEGIMIPQNG